MIFGRQFLAYSVLVVSGFYSFPAYVDDGLRESAVENFKLECWSNPKYDLALNFSPVRRLPESSQSEGKWSYQFLSDERLYPQQKVSLPDSGAVRVDLVTQLNQKDSDIGESYLWNVIVAPKVKGWTFGGHWPTKKPITEYLRLKEKRDSLVSMATLSIHNGHPVHTQILPKDIDSAGTLNNAWENLFGSKIVSSLVYPASKGNEPQHGDYSLTFYYMPTPELRLINVDGYKWPSFKHVDHQGKVYGFVLSPDGECLASTSVKVGRP